MSTLPFLLSVADELDNINSQSYMDDFGLGFHPHRQYYRSPTIQLSLPASTEWIQQDRHRYRSNKYSDDSHHQHPHHHQYHHHHQQHHYPHHHQYQHHLHSTTEAAGGETEDNADGLASASGSNADTVPTYLDKYGDRRYDFSDTGANTVNGSPVSSSHRTRQKFTSPLNSNAEEVNGIEHDTGLECRDNDGDNIDNSVQMYNLTKKCCKNYHRHSDATTVTSAASSSGACVSISMPGCSTGGASSFQTSTSTPDHQTASGVSSTPSVTGKTATSSLASSSMSAAPKEKSSHEGFKLHRKCLEGNNSSSDESLQKATSSIEFLTCFLLKKSRAPKNAQNTSGSNGGYKKS